MMNCEHFPGYPCAAGDPARCRGRGIRRLCELAGPEGSASYARFLAENPPDGPVAPAPPPRRSAAEALELRELIRDCPHLKPKEPGDGCGCLGRCDAGRGDLHEGRTSYRNCEECRAGELDLTPSTP